MNLVEKYFNTYMQELKSPIVKNSKLFLNGLSIKQIDSQMEILLYQEPITDIVILTVFDENQKELYSDRILFSNENGQEQWKILPTKN